MQGTESTPNALEGIRVLDLSRILAGPWCTQILADFGADVVKIERPGHGDDTRHWGPPFLRDGQGQETAEAAYYLAANRNKRSLAIDIVSPEGRDVILRLAERCDIFVENFKTGSLAEKGLGYEDLRAINPSIIYLSITGFGQYGPRSEQPGYDYLAQALGGMMSITGRPDDEPGAGPVRAGTAVADLSTGLYSTIAVLMALQHRQRTGEGQHIDMALLDSQVAMLANQATNFLCSGVSPVRTGGWHPNLAPYQPFEASDGPFILAVGNDGQFATLCELIGRPELASDPRYVTVADRNANRAELADVIAERLLTKPRAYWLQALPAAGVPASSLNSVGDVFDEPQVVARGMRIDLPHSTAGTAPGVANPIKMTVSPPTFESAPPTLGEHSGDVLAELGLSPDEIDQLRSGGIVA